MTVGGAATVVSVGLLKPIVNGMMDVEAVGAFKTLRFLAFTVAALYMVRGLATFGQLVIMSRTGNHIIASMQRRLYVHILGKPVAFFNDRHSSELMARLALAANGVRDIVQLIVTSAGRDLVTAVGLLLLMIYYDALMALMVLTCLPIGALFLGRAIRRIRTAARRSFDGSAKIMQIMQETALGIRIVKSFNLEDAMQTRMASSVREVEKAANRMALGVAMSSPVSETLGGILVALILLYGGWRVSVAHADPGSFFAFIVALIAAYEPVKRLGKLNLDLQNGLVNARMIYDVLDEPLPLSSHSGDDILRPTAGRIVFDNVSFGYRPDALVLDGLNLVAEPDRTTALVGPSGGGKSTIISLIQRFYEPLGGSITIDGIDVTSVQLSSLRDAIAFVSQDVFLFDGSVRDNIALGRHGATEADVVDAARRAHAHDFIMGLRDGYETAVGEHGSKLSGGQKQRIAIARALLKEASIILLDEPTAALDAESEREVQKALDQPSDWPHHHRGGASAADDRQRRHDLRDREWTRAGAG